MPVTHVVRRDRPLVELTLSGVLTLEEMVGAVQRVLADLEPGRTYDVLSDHRALTEPATPDQLLQLVEFLASRGTPFHGRRWAVAVGSAASYGMIRLIGVHLERLPIHVMPFYELAEAEAWLAGPGTQPSGATTHTLPDR